MQTFRKARFMPITITTHDKSRRVLNSNEFIKFPLNCQKGLGSLGLIVCNQTLRCRKLSKTPRPMLTVRGLYIHFLHSIPGKLWKISVYYWRQEKGLKRDICLWETRATQNKKRFLETPKSKERLALHHKKVLKVTNCEYTYPLHH